MSAFYSATISEFLTKDKESILGALALAGGNDLPQMQAWEEEISILKDLLTNDIADADGAVLFEYSIPRFRSRADVVLLIKGLVFCIEFKVGKNVYDSQDILQAGSYARDLKNFHKESQEKIVIPILVATEAADTQEAVEVSTVRNLLNIICCNGQRLGTVIQKVIDSHPSQSVMGEQSIQKWICSRYEPTPSIIKAAMMLYNEHTVSDIMRKEASSEELQQTIDFVFDVVKHTESASKAHPEPCMEYSNKAICFVTGVPGAGKTLVGLDVAMKSKKLFGNNGECDSTNAGQKKSLGVYLSGNGPLVKVLTAALARDKKKREQIPLKEAESEVKSFIQEIYDYRDHMLGKIKTPIENGVLEIDESRTLADKDAGFAEVEHIAIFDEAQRSWTHAKLADWLKRGGSYGNKRKVADFPMSESEFLIWSMNLRPDWAVIICLVGGGQEIHTGEAGITEWIKAVADNELFKEWDVYISPNLKGKEYSEGELQPLLNRLGERLKEDHRLHLSVTQRSIKAEKLSDFVYHLLTKNVSEAQGLYNAIPLGEYPIVLTRDLNKAKQWLKQVAKEDERYGVVVSSKAERLRPIAVDVKRKCDVVRWFLDGKEELRSSFFMEDVATEFDIQGLELDYTCLIWDADFRSTKEGWSYHTVRNSRWCNNNDPINQDYQLNAYRVLLTRARKGMVICVPEGSTDDHTRQPAFYDGTYEYLKSLGMKEI
jgi:DUF2075 family protein